MLTIDEIRDISFRKGKGYRSDDVDAFIDEVIVSFEQLKKDKKDLIRKMDILATKIEQYRADEETVRNALINAQKAADSLVNEAQASAAKIVSDAEDKAQKMLREANAVTAGQKDIYLKLKTDAVKLREELDKLYKKHLTSINDLPTDAVVAQTKAELDKKYPTEPVADEKAPIETEEKSAEIPASTEADIPVDFTVSEQPNKYDDLKFGDNYDVEDE